MAATLAAALLAGCATAPGPSSSPTVDVRSPHVGVTVPRTVAGFELVQTQHFAIAQAGSSWRYRTDSHPELWVDAYVYPTGIWPDDDSAIADLSEQTAADIQAAVDQGYYRDVEVLGVFRPRVDLPDARLSGVHFRMAMQMDEVAVMSHTHLFYLPPYAVKFRSSFPAYGNTSFDDRIGQLVPAFLAALQLDEAVRCRAVTMHGVPAGEPGWISKDGRDIVVPVDLGEAEGLKLIARSARQIGRSGCPEDAGTPIAPVATPSLSNPAQP